MPNEFNPGDAMIHIDGRTRGTVEGIKDGLVFVLIAGNDRAYPAAPWFWQHDKKKAVANGR